LLSKTVSDPSFSVFQFLQFLQRYLIKDHLGSLSLVTDEIGGVEQSNYFDPWGKERKIVTASSIKQ